MARLVAGDGRAARRLGRRGGGGCGDRADGARVVEASAGLADPSHADAKAKDGKVGLSVYGKGLRVDEVGARMEGHGAGVRARLITYTPKGYR
ncbi:hypothetical protein ACWGNM_31725 [Streptomyces sp. NPDC055796]